MENIDKNLSIIRLLETTLSNKVCKINIIIY